MRPKEFDELFRQKFEQNDFEYNPRNWDKLVDQMEGRARKRSIMMWWLMPVAGVAASLALAMVAPNLLQYTGTGTQYVQTNKVHKVYTEKKSDIVATVIAEEENDIQVSNETTMNHKQQSKPHIKKNNEIIETKEEKFAINYFNAVRDNRETSNRKAYINLLNNHIGKPIKEKEKNNRVASNEPVNTFKPDEPRPQPKLSIILSGGINQGSKEGGKGYAAGAAIRKMVSDKVFIEGNIAFASSNIAQNMPYRDPVVTTHYFVDGNTEIPTPTTSGKATNIGESGGKPITTKEVLTYGPTKQNNVSYNLSYMQVNPSIGYKFMKRLSVSAGPDFQQALADNRPTPSETNPGVNQRAPLFDMGLIGKTEVSLTKQIKAGVAYRKGINNILTPMGKYLDRDYLQLEVKYSIFNK